MKVPKLSDRQTYTLLCFYEKYEAGIKGELGKPLGIADTHRVPNSIRINGKYFQDPGGIGMAIVRGFQKRGWLEEPVTGLFYLTETGAEVAREILAKL